MRATRGNAKKLLCVLLSGVICCLAGCNKGNPPPASSHLEGTTSKVGSTTTATQQSSQSSTEGSDVTATTLPTDSTTWSRTTGTQGTRPTIPPAPQEDVLTVENGYSYTGVGANTKKASLPASPKQYTGEIVFIKEFDSYLPLDSEDSYDLGYVILALQGLANREKPSIYIQRESFKQLGESTTVSDGWVQNMDADYYWLDYLTSPGQYLEKANIKTWSASSGKKLCEELLLKFKDCYNGLVVWDPDVYSTSLVAATIAGCDNLLPVRYSTRQNSMYVFLTQVMKIPVKVDLTDKFTGEEGTTIWQTSLPSTGSAKNDAYLYAKVNYLDSGKTNANWMGHLQDAAPLPGFVKTSTLDIYRRTIDYQIDWMISAKAFVFDLCPIAYVLPYDDSEQKLGTDYATFNKILESQYKRAGGKIFNVIGWFNWKTQHSPFNSYEDVEIEFRYISLLSQYNGRGQGGSQAMNASLTYHVPEMSSYKQKASKNVDLSKYDPDKIYMMVYMADYDGTGSLQLHLPRIWENDARGKMPLAWGIAGSQAEDSHAFFNYMYQTATPNDYFVSTNAGGAYLNPLNLLPENKDKKYARKVVPDGVDTFMEYVAGLSKKYDLSCDPRLIFTNGMWPDRLLKAFADVSTTGLSYWNHGDAAEPFQVENSKGELVPVVKSMLGVNNTNTEEEIYQKFKNYVTSPRILDVTQGMIYEIAVLVSPGVIYKTIERLKSEGINLEVVGPYEFFAYSTKRMEERGSKIIKFE